MNWEPGDHGLGDCFIFMISAPLALGIADITIATATTAFLDIDPRLSFATSDGWTFWTIASAIDHAWHDGDRKCWLSGD